MSEAMTTREVADELGTDPKTLRKFFRSKACDVTPVGQGSRYQITQDDVDELKAAFSLWAGGKAKKADTPAPPKAKKAKGKKKAAPIIADDPDEDLEFDDAEPTAEELEELELDD